MLQFLTMTLSRFKAQRILWAQSLLSAILIGISIFCSITYWQYTQDPTTKPLIAIWTSLCVLLCGLDILAQTFSAIKTRFVIAISILVASIINAWALSTYTDFIPQNVDSFNLILTNYIWMQPTSNLCYLLISIAIFISYAPQRQTQPITTFCAAFVHFIAMNLAFIGLLGNNTGWTPSFLGWQIYIAPLTSLCILIYSAQFMLSTCKQLYTGMNKLKTSHRFMLGIGFLIMIFASIVSISLMETDALVKIANRLAEANQPTHFSHELEQAEDNAAKILISLFIILFALGGIIAYLILRGFKNQLSQIMQAMEWVAHGNTSTEIPFTDHNQEIGELARGLEKLSEDVALARFTELQLQQMIEAVPTGLLRTNQNGTIEMLNAQVELIFGYSREELIGQKIEKLIPEKFRDQHHHYRDGYFKSPTHRAMGAGRELFGLRKDGSEVPIEIGLAPIHNTNETKILASIVDITARLEAEKALNESRERLEIATKVNNIGVWEYNFTTQQLFWNDAMFDIYGRRKELFKGDYQDWRQTCHPDDLAQVEKDLNNSISSLTAFTGKFRIIHPDGSIRHILAKAKVDKLRNGQLRVLGTNIDITREEKTLEKIHEAETLRSSVVEFSEDAIISKTPFGVVTSWNLGAERMFGYTAAEAVGKPVTQLLFPAERMSEEEYLLSEIRSGKVVSHYETVRRCKDGRLINISVTLSPIKDKQDRVIGVSAIKRDITHAIENARLLKERQKELEDSNFELEKTNKELQSFAYVASHDLKSPLRGIAQLSSWIEEDLAAGDIEKVNQHTQFLRGRINRMEKLLDDLLKYYRAGRNSGTLGEVDLNFLVRELFETQNTQSDFKLVITNPLPTIITYVTPLEQILRNLISNALKHHDKTDGTITISSSISSSVSSSISSNASSNDGNSGFLEIIVSDDGPGIPEQYHQRIFEMFQTLKTRDEVESSGIGLTLVKKILESFGGKVIVRSKGRGTSFIILWPLRITTKNQNNDTSVIRPAGGNNDRPH